MPGFLSLFNTPERVHVADGYWIDIKTNLTTEDYEKAQRVLFNSVELGASGEMQTAPDAIAFQMEQVFLSIVDWNLTDEDGVLLPLSTEDEKRASIKKLPQSVFTLVYDRVVESNQPRSKEDEVSFRADGPVSTDGIG